MGIIDKTGKTVTLFGNTVAKYTSPKIHSWPEKAITFDGTGDYLTIPASDVFDFGLSDFTIEFWFNVPVIPGYYTVVRSQNYYTAGYNGNWIVRLQNNLLEFTCNDGTTSTISGGGTFTLTANTWYHAAIVRTNKLIYFYINGILLNVVSGNSMLIDGKNGLVFGAWSTHVFNGMLSNIRISNGIARYTSNFTPPTAAFVNDSYTKLLISPIENQNSKVFSDSSSNKHVITTVGDCKSVELTKFNDKVLYFDGVDDSLFTPVTNDFKMGQGDFTIDVWCYLASTLDSTFKRIAICGGSVLDWNATNGVLWQLYMNTDNKLGFQYYSGGTSQITISASSVIDITHSWHHIAVVRYNGKFIMYIDGISVGTTTGTTTDVITSINGVWLGGFSANLWKGYISNFRITKGLARWTCNFVPPTSPSETQLPIEIEKWTGREAILWTKVPAVTSNFDTSLILKVDKSQIDNYGFVGDVGQEAATRVWSNNYVGVWHMNQDPSGVAPQILDSTNRKYHGTSSGSMTYSDLIELITPINAISRGLDFDGSDDYIVIPDSDEFSFNGTTEIPITFEAMLKKTIDNTNMPIVVKDDGTGTYREWNFGTFSANNTGVFVYVATNSSNYLNKGASLLTKDNLWYASASYDGSKISDGIRNSTNGTILDGVSANVGTYTGMSNTIQPVHIGRLNTLYFNGQMYELRITRGIVRSPAYLKAVNESLFDCLFYFKEKRLYLPRFTGAKTNDISLTSNVASIDDNVRLLLPMSDSNSTIIVDKSNYSNVVTKYGNSRIVGHPITNATNAIYFDGTGDYLTIADSSDWNFNGVDFTLEAWVNLDDYGANIRTLLHTNNPAGTNYIGFYLDYDGMMFTTEAWTTSGLKTGRLSLNTWHHVAITRSSTLVNMFVDGVLVNSRNDFNKSNFDSSGLLIGNTPWSNYNKGYICNLRVSKGIARYTALNFTPPSEYFTPDSYTILLLHDTIEDKS